MVLFTVGPAYAIVVGAWVGSGATWARPGLGLALALLGGFVATLGFGWFVGTRERADLLEAPANG